MSNWDAVKGSQFICKFDMMSYNLKLQWVIHNASTFVVNSTVKCDLAVLFVGLAVGGCVPGHCVQLNVKGILHDVMIRMNRT